MAEWIQLDVAYFDNPKIEYLAEVLGMDEPMYAGAHHLKMLTYISNHFPTGVIQGPNVESRIAKGSGWKGDAKGFVDALVEARLLHRTDTGAEICEKCFPPNDDGTPRALLPGCYVVHKWKERAEAFLYYRERRRIIREQNAARWRQKRDKEKKGSVVRERPERPYKAQQRGLRAAPGTVQKFFDDALEGLTSRKHHAEKSVTSRKKKRDVTVLSRVTSRSGVFLAETEKKPENGISESLNDIRESTITQMSRTYRHTYIEPSSKDNDNYKDTLLSLSLKDRESLKSGAEKDSAPSVSPSEPAKTYPPTHQGCVDFWCDTYKLRTGKSYPTKRIGHVAIVVSRLVKPKGNYPSPYSYAEILHRMASWFASTWEIIATEWNYKISEFERRIVDLTDGPLKSFDKPGGLNEPYQPRSIETRDDFGGA